MPSYLSGADYVRTFNDDKMRNDVEIEVLLGRPARLFVFYDRRLKVPDWLAKDFQDTGQEIGQDLGRISHPGSRQGNRLNWKAEEGPGRSIDLRFSIWERRVNEPGIIHLGASGNFKRRSAAGMYGIAAVALEPEPDAQNVPRDAGGS